MRALLLLLLLLASSSCAATSRVTIADSAEGCRALGQVEGAAGWGGVLAELTYEVAGEDTGRAEAVAEAAAEAAALGATHLVIVETTGRQGQAEVIGAAYRCEVR